MPFLFCGAWSPERARTDSRFPALLSWIAAGTAAAQMNNDEATAALDTNDRGAALSNMRAFRTSGPGILRFAFMPRAFWVGFLCAAAEDLDLHLVTNARISELITFVNELQVERLQYQQKHMAKAALPDTADLRKRA
jgi:hypothetical protein